MLHAEAAAAAAAGGTAAATGGGGGEEETDEAAIKEKQLLRCSELLLRMREQSQMKMLQQQRCELLQLCLPQGLLQQINKKVDGPLLLEA